MPSGLNGADEPALPSGLGATDDEPSLPRGLSGEEPQLPAGLDSEQESADSDFPGEDGSDFPLTGFWEALIGARLKNDPYNRDMSLAETRLHMEYEKAAERLTAALTADLVYDSVLSDKEIDLETGKGWIDLREAALAFSPIDILDVKIGRQTLTWGTGDLLFINDLFPKDWNSFFIGRNDEYLKVPSDAVKFSLYKDFFNIDVIYTPKFDADRFIDGRRISYYDANSDSLAGKNSIIKVSERNDWFSEDEIAVRLYKNIGSYELALYGYSGYWKSPNGLDAASGLYTFPKLRVYGFSARGPFLTGIVNAEAGLYKSREDSGGGNPLIRNSEFRFLLGYEQEIKKNLTAGFQYYLEHMLQYGAYRSGAPAGMSLKDKSRHVITLRITQLMMNQNLQLSLFQYYSPSDSDGYFRPKANYKINDHYTVEAGANIFFGASHKTFFGQFENNTNFYASMRYSY